MNGIHDVVLVITQLDTIENVTTITSVVGESR